MKLLKNSFIYLSVEVINKAIPFLLLPIITKYLTPVEYGLYGMYQVLISFLVPFIRMSLDIHITRNFFKVSKERLSEILSSILVILHINVLISIVLIYILTIFFQNPFGLTNEILYIMPIVVYVQIVNSFNLTILRNKEKALLYGVVQIAITIVNFSVILLLLLFYHKGWQSLVYATLISHSVVLIYSLVYLKKEYSLKTKFSSFKDIYEISIPLIFHAIGNSIIFLSDRLFIEHFLGLKEVGIYTIGNQFGMITMVVINAVIMAINPWMYKKLANDTDIYRSIYLFMVLFSIFGLFVWLGSLWFFPYIVDDRYLNAQVVILWISLAFVFRGWYQLYYNVIVHYGKTNIFMYITFGSAVVNLVLNYILIGLNGLVGTAQATSISFFMMFLSVSIYANKLLQQKG